MIDKNILMIKNFLNNKGINIDYLDDIFSKVIITIGKKEEYPYACISQNNPYEIIISEDIKEEDRYKWLNHELIHVISNNLKTTNETNIGGVIIEDNNKWIGRNLNEAITEYISQLILKDKYSDYYDNYIKDLNKIISFIGEDIVIKCYFNNDLKTIYELIKEYNIDCEILNDVTDYYENRKNTL